MRKLYELGAKTGLDRAEVNRIAKFGVLGLLALGLASLAACFKAQKPAEPAASKPTLQDLVNSVNASTDTSKPQDNCGPYPGYPCGTRYYTVSRGDFRRQA
ncbi:MAG: hypothetical protein NDI60_00045 [Elusimicrobiales bacterium]|nr:hypothetical protein [Elusimicrobiales bacterium]